MLHSIPHASLVRLMRRMPCVAAGTLLLAAAASEAAPVPAASTPGESTVGSISREAASADSLLQDSAVRVYLDGLSASSDYVKTNITFVNYVRDPMQAQVHVLGTSQSTAQGGYCYTVVLMGRESFCGMNDTLTYVSRRTDTEEMTRDGVVRTLKMGLMRYVARSPLAPGISISYAGAAKPSAVTDPWDYWYFSLGGDMYMSGTEKQGAGNLSGGATAQRVTSALKLYFHLSTSYSESKTELATRTLRVIRRTNTLDAKAVKSLSKRWSAGLFGEIFTSSYTTKKSYYTVAPAIEFDVFPYSESTHRMFTLSYCIKLTDVRYHEKTIYNKTEETLLHHALAVDIAVRERWGSIGGSVDGTQYFHDPSIYRLSAMASLGVRLFEGFGLSISGGYSRIHDEIDQPKRNLTDDEVLLNLRNLASTYSFNFSIGFSYSFGSRYSNVVNPRFKYYY